MDTEWRIVDALYEAYVSTPEPENLATLVLCSHRLAVFPRAGRVIVINKGKIVEQGTHAAQVDSDGLYARICIAQHRIEGGVTPWNG